MTEVPGQPEYEEGNAAGLMGRPQQRDTLPEPDTDEEVEYVETEPERPAKAIPAHCLRVLNTPLNRDLHGCHGECAGLSMEGYCLAEIVRRANEQGVDWSFDLERHGERWWWVYAGDPVDLSEPEVVPPPPQTFECPHCGNVNEHDPQNFHFWCAGCGKNARDRVVA